MPGERLLSLLLPLLALTCLILQVPHHEGKIFSFAFVGVAPSPSLISRNRTGEKIVS